MVTAMESVTGPPPVGWSLPPAPQSPPLPGPTPDPPGVQRPANGQAVAALVLGVLGLSLATNPALFVLAIPVGLAAVVCGVIAIRRADETGLGKGQAIAGIVTGGLGAVGGVVWIAVVGSLVSAFLDVGGTATTQPPPGQSFTATGPACEDADDQRRSPERSAPATTC